jgi:fructosamine-3-kinase
LGLEAPVQVSPLVGGSINELLRLQWADGRSLIAKLNSTMPADFFTAEAEGLQLLAEHSPLRTPDVLAVADDHCLLADLGAAGETARFWEALGRGLAQQHTRTNPTFGLETPNYGGATPQDNTATKDGFEFFAERRILALTRRCFDHGLLESADSRALERLSSQLPQLVPEMPAVLLHGDLWSGNVHCCGDGQPALIDPAAHWGWAESDLAMTILFGGFADAFYASYGAQAGVQSDWRGRAPLYNLYPLLNHLLLFGVSYSPSIKRVLNRYG